MKLRPSRMAWVPVILVLLVPVALHQRHARGGTAAGGNSPVFGAAALDSLLEAWRGRPAILSFWATWCTPCVGELPVLDSLYRESSGALLVVAIDVGDPDSTTAGEFLELMPLAMPVVWLDADEAEETRSRLGIPVTLPVTLFLDASGSEVARVSGARDREFLGTMAASLIEGGSAARDTAPGPGSGLHVNVVGPPGDSLTSVLAEAAVLAAGEGGVDVFDPTDPEDLARLDSLYLPREGWPYAQPCAGTSCGRPARTPEALLEEIEQLTSR